ncbi:group II intron reverse transcriptase/maturase [Oceanobacillus oncorhynchi subsp. incaldanensis]|uniref:group II intron reverse transcriptase/maturase n=1 Tax=Oceanobacillus oncorhynchi TaxID=545501 RepID=UPI001B018336|nr:group II intron reverse transcriptase/maturase [Oceanobacillus oncorhynchi]GIO18459.1 group II intron reverse transcriptase/maturase [Oceanobacillus oncorhynchi subsp. incaldanensis]HIS29523.1 group II intron reverse transcriptase/maturase [Candidatus Avamphibacillus intestinigallinarum]
MQTNMRYWEYYNMTDTFTDLYGRSKQGDTFNRLYDLITSRENILLAYRTIKSNKGSKTEGTDGKKIDDIKTMKGEEIVSEIQRILLNYQPKKVRRVFIPKPNGDKRPLGIPSIMDRIIQQCFKQVLEPIAEAKFYNHSYGFRPQRSTHHAIARVQHLINHAYLHYVVDIDIKGFFDNINHTLLLKQLWNMGIQDKKVLKIVSKMLKAEIEGEGIPHRGTMQGGILSPLLSNIVLNDLDHWVADQWELFETDHKYSRNTSKYLGLNKNSNLKEGYIIRYADDFKIMCKDWKTAEKWFHAVRLYLKDRLKLEISPEKSQIVNLRKRKSKFLGFTIWTEQKRNKHVAHTGLIRKKKQEIKQKYKEHIKIIQKSPKAKNITLFNSFVLGIHNYFKKATMVNIEFAQIAYDLSRFIYNRLKSIGKYEKPKNPSKVYKKFYKNAYKTYKVNGIYLFPIADVQTSNNINFSQDITPFTVEGRNKIHQKLKPNVAYEVNRLMQSYIPNRTTEYMDNRISRYSMKNGKCEISGEFLPAEFVHCHHHKPVSLGGTDEFRNLRIIHKDIHILVHATKDETIQRLVKFLKLTDEQLKKINQYRKVCNLELIG